MIRFLARRLVLLVGMLAGLVVITFAVSNIAPSDPAALAAGPDATRDMVETVRREYGLDRPLPEQFLRYVSDLARGNLGRSVATGNQVGAELARYVPASLELVLLAMAFAILVGIPFGVLAAVWQDGTLDHLVRVLAVSGVALPAFWAGLLLQLVFSVWLGWLPTSGQLSVSTVPPATVSGMVLLDAVLTGQWRTAAEAAHHAVLPALVLSLPCLASIVRIVRSEMVEVLGADHVTAARAHGIGSGRLIGWLALKNAMLPTLATIGLRFGWMLGSTVLVETVFDWSGAGLYAVNSAIASDIKPVMGVTLVLGALFMLTNLVVDMALWLAGPTDADSVNDRPHFLPADIDFETKPILRKLASAHRALAELKGASGLVPNEGILINTLSLQEARDSSAIENIITTQDDLFRSDAAANQFASIAAKEVHSYARALREGFSTVRETHLLTTNGILSIQATLEANQAGFRKLPGTTLRNDRTGEVVFTPPQDYTEIVSLMTALERFINDDTQSDLDPLIKMAIIHHQFETIHPFYDGNGRTGRIINILYLVLRGLLDVPVLYLSRYINKNKSRYYQLLQAVREQGEWEDWILFMLEGVEETAFQTTRLVHQIKQLMLGHKRRLRSELPRIYNQDLLNIMFSHPYSKIAVVQRDLSSTLAIYAA